MKKHKPRWVYNGEYFDIAPQDQYGFVYYLRFDDGTKYIGQKAFWSVTTTEVRKDGKVRPDAIRRIRKRKPMTASELANRTPKQVRGAVNTKLVEYDVLMKESTWKNYEGSSKRNGTRKVVHKEIMQFAPSKRALTYLETKLLFMNEVLEDEAYINDNILGKFHRNTLFNEDNDDT